MAFLDETGVTTLTSDIKALTDATYPANATIVDGYNSSSAYAVGDFCIHDGLFYKCNTAIASGGETWTAAHWTQTNVTSEWGTKMVVLSYGSSTWADFQAAFDANAVVYCKASSNSNPATGNQGRMAFMAYVGYSGSTITNVEFQYYRSVSSHSASQQGDQVFIYKLENTNGGKWTVTTREAATTMVAGTGLSSAYSSGTLTLSADMSAIATGVGLNNIYSVVISDTQPTDSHINGWIDSDTMETETVPQIDDSQTSYDDTYSSAKINNTYLSYDVVQSLTDAQKTQVASNFGIESGTNASGDSYCKMPDGTLMCFGYFTENVSGNSYVEHTITYPIGFISAASLTCSSIVWSDPRNHPVLIRGRFSSSGVVRVGNYGSSATDVGVNWIALGRWK